MNSREFAEKFLPMPYAERDLQLLVQRRIKRGGLKCDAEVNIKTISTTRRSDLETWYCRYELKRELNYDSLLKALGQLYIYDKYGLKILGFIPKRKCIIGLAPAEEQEFKTALKLAADIEAMGIQVIFISEYPNWGEAKLSRNQLLLTFIVFVVTFTLSYLAATR